MALHRSQIQFMNEMGFLAIPALVTVKEALSIAGLFDELIGQRAGWTEGHLFDLLGSPAEAAELRLPQLMNPILHAPMLELVAYRRLALELARELLGTQAQLLEEYALWQPPLSNSQTPWMQDEAYWNPDYAYHSLAIRLSLQVMNDRSGAPRFIPRSHRGPLLRHRPVQVDGRAHGLVARAGAAQPFAIPCTLPPGSVTLHWSRTLYRSAPNPGAHPCRSYVMTFGRLPRRVCRADAHPWLAERRLAIPQQRGTIQRAGFSLYALVHG